MKRLLYGVLAATLALAGIAQAAQNLRQNQDGTADFIGSDGGSASPVGGVYLQFVVPTLTSSASYRLVSPISNAKIVDATLVRLVGVAGSGTATINLFAGQTTTPVRLQSQVGPITGTANVTKVSIIHTMTSNVTALSITAPTAVTSGLLRDNTLEKGGIIHVDLVSTVTGAVTGMLIITVQPK